MVEQQLAQLEQFRRKVDDLAHRIDRLAATVGGDPHDNPSIAGQLALAERQIRVWAPLSAEHLGDLASAYSSLHLAEKIFHFQMMRVVAPHIGQGHGADDRSSQGGIARAVIYEEFKDEVRGWWKRWQREPDLYKNKTAFDDAMADKTGLATRTVADYRKEIAKE